MGTRIKNHDGPAIVICCGSGGVGKTTVSAALGMYGALSGRNTMILTIDPARRLADALGLKDFNTEAQRVVLDAFPSMSHSPPGCLYAMMLDAKRTFDELIKRYAPPDLGQKIFDNRYYQYISNHMAGSHEYMAMEKLYEIHQQAAYDLIVLDTPPTRRALDFLDAPQRLLNILGHSFFFKLFQPYLHAGRWGFRLLNLIASPVLRAVGKVIGRQAMADFTAFMRLWDDVLFEGFSRRASAVKDLLASSQTLFWAVATPQRRPLAEAMFLYKTLCENQMPFGGFLINRVHWCHPTATEGHGDLSGQPGNIEKWIPSELMAKMRQSHAAQQDLARSDAESIAEFRKKIGADVKIVEIAAASSEIFELKDVYEISRQLMAAEV